MFLYLARPVVVVVVVVVVVCVCHNDEEKKERETERKTEKHTTKRLAKLTCSPFQLLGCFEITTVTIDVHIQSRTRFLLKTMVIDGETGNGKPTAFASCLRLPLNSGIHFKSKDPKDLSNSFSK